MTEGVHGEEVEVTFRRPRNSDWTDLLNSLPHFLGQAAESNGETRRVGVPASELRILLDFMHLHTLSISGVIDREGHPVRWEALTPDERDQFWEGLPQSASANFFLCFLGKMYDEDLFEQDIRKAEKILSEQE